MRLDQIFKVELAAALLIVASPVFPQATQAAQSTGGLALSLSVGAGASSYNVDWGHGEMQGATIWVDLRQSYEPAFLRGIGIEGEYRDIRFGPSSTQPVNFRLLTAGGGVIYCWEKFRNIHPCGKVLTSFGGIDWKTPNPHFQYTTRVTAPGFGFEYRVLNSLWLRAEYEYQFWPDLETSRPHSTHVLNPEGVTIGASYSIGRLGRHRMHAALP
jgi:hypothetical protein